MIINKMKYKEKIREFMEVRNLNKRDLANKLKKSESLISRWTNADKPSLEFITALSKVYPELDFNWLLKDASGYEKEKTISLAVFDTASDYGKSATDLIDEIEQKLSSLREKVAQNSHRI